MGWRCQVNLLFLCCIRPKPSCFVQCVQPSIPRSLVDTPTEPLWLMMTHHETAAAQQCITLHLLTILSCLTSCLSHSLPWTSNKSMSLKSCLRFFRELRFSMSSFSRATAVLVLSMSFCSNFHWLYESSSVSLINFTLVRVSFCCLKPRNLNQFMRQGHNLVGY